MPLVKNAATNLAQGVSQQAESQRYPSQATEQINAYSSPIKGLVKRPPTKHITNVALDTTNENKTFVHTINRDSSEQYVLAIDKQESQTVTAVSAGNNTITVGTSIDANTAVRFQVDEDEGQLPTGLKEGRTYYIKTTGTTVSLSTTSGGSDTVGIGKVNVSDIAIESVKHTDGRWVDGVFAITLASGHSFAENDVVRINGLTGDAGIILNANQDFILRKTSQDMAKVTSSGTAVAPATNKFLLGRVGGDPASIDDNLGYAVDDRWVTDGGDDGWNMLGNSTIHWQFKKDSGSVITSSSSDTVVNKMVYNSDDASDFTGGWLNNLSNFQVGDLIRLGSYRNTDKSIRVRITHVGNATDRTLTFDYVDIGTLFDTDTSGDATDRWNYLAYWGDTTSSIHSDSNPRQFQSGDISGAHIGTDTGLGAFSLYTGGVKVYDINTKQEKTVNIDSGLNYITATADPAAELSAVTVADYTFIVNKTVQTEAAPDIKYNKNYEAFITAKTADYGKKYSIKVGGEVNKQYSGDAKESELKIDGVDSQGVQVPVAKLKAKTQDSKFSGYQVRLLQNWKYTKNVRTVPSRLRPSTAVSPSEKQYSDLLPPSDHRVNEYVGIEYNKADKVINIWINFSWAKAGTTAATKRTTVDHLIKAVASSPLGEDFEVKELNASGDEATGSSSNLFFLKTYVGQAGEKKTATYTETAGTGSKDIPFTWYEGPDETVGQTINEYAVAGYLSPSAGTLVVRGRYTGKGVQAATTASDFNNTKLEDGEFLYRTARWTGQASQEEIGTERIAEMLASNAKITQGTYDPASPSKANGLPITKKHTHAETKEDCLGLTWSHSNHANQYLAQYSGQGRVDDHTENWSVIQEGYTIALKNPEGSRFSIQVSDDLGGNGLKLTYFEVDEATELPDVCRHGHVVKVVGNAREEADDYYLRFVADVEDPNELRHGRWVECVGYEQKYKFDSSTMPVGLVRESDESFTLKELTWNERQAGDEATNPFPSFTGNTINDVFLFRNRLGFLSGENIIFSEAGEYFNFFRSTAAALLDTAPIDVTASTNKVSTLHSAIPYKERLIIFSDQTQFVLDADPFLSVKTVTLSPSNEIESLTGVKPVVSGSSVFYGYGKTDYSGVGELTVAVEDADQMDTSDATGHVPKYIKGSIRKIAAATNEDVVCFITDDTTSATLYVYKYFTGERNEKMQAAWFKYTFGAANDYITDISFIGNTLYMILRRSNVMYLESLTFEDDIKDTSMDYLVRLDRKRNKSDFANDQYSATTITLPYNATANTRVVTAGSILKASTTTGSTTFTLSGVDLTAVDWWVGELYDMEYTFSQPFLKSDKTTETGRYQIQRGILEYANARSFDVEVTHNPKMDAPNKQTITNTFANDAIHSILTGSADLQDGFFKFGVQGKNDKLQLKIKNNTPYPSDFLSIDYEARAFSRGSRWRG